MKKHDTAPVQASRRRFVVGALGLGGGALLSSVAGCREPTAPGAGNAPVSQPTPSGLPPLPSFPTAAPAAAVAPAAAAPAAGAPGLPAEKNPANFIVHNVNPVALETRRELMGASLTATSLLFLRQNVPLPPVSFVTDRGAWTTRVQGVVREAELTVEALKTLGVVTMATVLQCSGNGRKFYEHGPGGSPWGVGAAGCVMWTGVPLKNVVQHLGGVVKGMRYLTTTGGEPLPAGVERNSVVAERSIPVEKALDDTFLAWEMNGEPIPHCHGGPLRLIVPGYYGCNQIKFVKSLAFTAEQTRAKMQHSSYRIAPIGQASSPDMPSMWAMGVKSFITSPGEALPVRTGRVQVTGVAFGGEEAVTGVQVSLDGLRWLPTEWVGPDLGRYAWRVFRTELELTAPGKVTLYSRARTKKSVQPEHREENDHGYANTSWRDMGSTVSVCSAEDRACLDARPLPAGKRKPPAGPIELSEAGKRGRDLFTHQAAPPCGTCHTIGDAGTVGQVGPRLDELQRSYEQVKNTVKNGIGVMPPFGQTLTEQQLEDVSRYVYEVMTAK